METYTELKSVYRSTHTLARALITHSCTDYSAWVKKCLKRSSERLNGVFLRDALGEDIPEGRMSDIPEDQWPYHLVLESLGLRTSKRDLDSDLTK